MINDYEATEPIVPNTAPIKTENNPAVDVLNGLIEVCKDGQAGFEQAATGVERPDLQTLFREYAYRRSQFVGELQSLVHSLGGSPETSGTFTGALHRGWMNIKSVVTGKDEAAILSECERGEDSARNAYEEAQEQALPDYVRDVVNGQYAEILSAHDNVRALRDAANNKTKTARSSR